MKNKTAKKASSISGRTRKRKASAASTTSSTTKKKKLKKEEEEEDEASDEEDDGAVESLNGKTVCFAGTLSAQTHAEATKVAKGLGAKVTTAVSGRTDILVAGDGAPDAKIKQAKSKGVEVWTEEKFNDVVNGGGKKKRSKRKASAASTISSTTKKKKLKKEEEEEDEASDEEDDGAVESLNGKTVCFTGTLSTQTRAEATKVAKGLGAKVTAALSGKTDLLVAGDGAPDAKIKQAKSKGVEVWTEEKFNDVVGIDNAHDETENMKEEADEVPLSSTAKKKTSVAPTTPGKKKSTGTSGNIAPSTPATPGSTVRKVMSAIQNSGNKYQVYNDYDVKLMLSDSLNANSNKFYKLQLLQNGNKFHVATNWGRLGEPGKSQLKGPFDEEDGIKAFSKQFTSKTANKWGTRPFVRHEKKYQLVETTISDDGNDGSSAALGRLTESQINKGQEVLEQLRNVLESSSNKNTKRTIGKLSNDFYSLIPTTSGRQRPPPLDNLDIITEKEGLLEFWLRMGFEEVGDVDVKGSPIEGVFDLPLPKNLSVAAASISDSSSIASSRDRGLSLAKQGPGKKFAELYAAILLYTGNSIYRDLNNCLRTDWKSVKKYWNYLRLYFEAMDSMQGKSVTLYRGIAVDLYNEYIPGKIITWWSVSSCTSSKEVAENFMGQLGGSPATFITLHTKNACDVSGLSFYPSEKESLLRPGTKLKVLNRTKKGNTTTIEVEEVDDEEE